MKESLAYDAYEGQTRRPPRYRDELNFAEFPLAALSDTAPNGQKTLVFHDSVFDRSRSVRVDRKLTITASDEFGLPTALDDEVILGLIQLSARNDFRERKVHFTRRDLIRELSWRDESKSYARIESSLKRWLGVTLYYENAWWSKEEQCWVDESFHILDQVTIFDRERIARRIRTLPDDPNAGLSSFVWNDVVFNSFSKGYLKQLDFSVYKALGSQIAKRMYRFLDKRFYKSRRLQFNLTEFAFEKIGLSRKYHTGEIKRRLIPAITELEEIGFLEPMPNEGRFVRECRGSWTVVFLRSGKEMKKVDGKLTDNNGANLLIAQGVSAKAAEALANAHSEENIRDKIAFVTWLRTRGDRRISKNPAGFLVKAITDNYPLPGEFLSEQSKASKTPLAQTMSPRRPHLIDQKAGEERAKREQFLSTLSAAQQEELLQVALRSAPKFLNDRYLEGQEKGGPLFEAAKATLLDRGVKAIFEAKAFEHASSKDGIPIVPPLIR